MRFKLKYNPLTFFWIATYRDGTALPQFDPETGKEHLFREVDQTKLDTFGWYPFTVELSRKIPYVAHVKRLPHYTVKLGNGEKLVAFKRQYIKYGLRPEREKGRETVYVLGYKDGPKLFIGEDGNVEVESG